MLERNVCVFQHYRKMIVKMSGTGYPCGMNIGCDVESVDEFRKHWKRKNQRFFARIFSESEIKYCTSHKDPSPHFAARFCAKEAIVKAASQFCKLVIGDIQVRREKNGAPSVQVWKKRKQTAKFFRDHQIMVSLSHTQDVAMACVLIQKSKG